MKQVDDYRLSSLEEPTDEQLAALMESVAEDIRKATAQYKEDLDRRMKDVVQAARLLRRQEHTAP